MPKQKSITHRMFGNHVSNDAAREVWAHLSKHPNDSVRDIAKELGRVPSCVAACIRFLAAAGYVEHNPAASRGHRVIVPLVTLGVDARIIKNNKA